MKKIVIYVILLLLFGFTSSFAQATKAKTAEKSEATAVLDDPKLSQEEMTALSKAGEDNPAKIDESMLIDPKLDPKSLPSEKDFGASNAKPSEESMVDPKLTGENVAGHQKETWESGAKPVDDRSQPEGGKVGTIFNYRDLPAGGNNQPASDSPQNTLNYRDIQGPREQPTSTIPNK